MAYQAGTLLSSGGDVYEQLMDIIKSFSETAGWTTNLYDDDSSYYETNDTYHASGGYAGKRLHMQKSINGTVRCINIKSCFNECPTYHAYSSYGLVSGLAINGSTGYDAGLRWEQQTGASYSGGGSYYVASAAFDIPTDILNYYLVHIVDGLADIIYLQVQNLKGYVGFLFGTTSLDVFVVGGSANTVFENTQTEGRNSLLYYSDGESFGNSFTALYTGGAYNGWYAVKQATTKGVKLPYQRLVDKDSNGYTESHTLLYCSPDNFKGNAPLIPVNLQIINSSSLKKDIGTLPGVKYVNMQNIASLREETYGADTWKFFRQYSTDDSYKKTGGLAFLIS